MSDDDATPRYNTASDLSSRPSDAVKPQGSDILMPYEGVTPYEGLRLSGAMGHSFQLTQRIESGAFGSIWVASIVDGPLHDPARHDVVAVKILDRPRPGAAADEYRRSLDRGDYVVRGIDHSRPEDSIAFVAMRYVPGAHLSALVAAAKDQGGHGVDGEKLPFLLEAFEVALPCLYEFRGPRRERSYHGDISPRNLVWHAPPGVDRGQFVIVDLGPGHGDEDSADVVPPMARYVTPDMFPAVDQGVAPYPIYNDIHQAAQVILYALTGEHPTSPHTTTPEELEHLADLVPEGLPPELSQLLKDMLTPDPLERSRRIPITEFGERMRAARLSLRSEDLRGPFSTTAEEDR
ncbi:MAG: hypothetical protein QM621_04075 [Aeromicrobium sp.]|uniref:hypothetical protein n=1 Tax=Aeromicrobium sp. TaxID=1871063 RepID=UPI0039E2C7CD